MAEDRVTSSTITEPGVRPAARLNLSLNSQIERLSWSNRLSLTSRILAVNILPLALLGGGIFYLDGYRKQLLDERYKLARIEAQITAEALAGASKRTAGGVADPDRQGAADAAAHVRCRRAAVGRQFRARYTRVHIR